MKTDIKNRNSILSSEFADEILWSNKNEWFENVILTIRILRILCDIVFRWDDRLIIDYEKI